MIKEIIEKVKNEDNLEKIIKDGKTPNGMIQITLKNLDKFLNFLKKSGKIIKIVMYENDIDEIINDKIYYDKKEDEYQLNYDMLDDEMIEEMVNSYKIFVYKKEVNI